MKIRVFFQSLFPSLRASELAEFRQWIHARNINRARLVGYLLLPFAVVGLIPEMGISEFVPDLPLIELITITTALLLLEWGRRRLMRWMLALGQIVLFLSASGWMVVSILSRLEIAFALPEFIIGVLALALMRILSPMRGVFAFSGMAAGYVIILVHQNHYDADALSNAVLVSLLALFWSWGMYRGRIMEFRNKQLVEQLQQRNHELNLLAEHDSLTSLPNRRSFDQLMERWWSDPAMQNMQVSLILIDADFFKQYNDAYGHPAGDVCLQKIAQSLQHNLRDEGTVMRLGGEEFVVALEGLSLETSLSIARRLVKRVADETETTVSAGVASVRPSQADPVQLYHLADAALYRAKSAGRNRVAA